MLAEMIEKRKRLHDENVGMIQTAKKDGRDVLNPAEEEEYNNRELAYEAVDRQVQRLQKQARIESALAEVEPRKADASQPTETRGSAAAMRSIQRSQDDLDLAIRGWMLHTRGLAKDEHHAAAKRVWGAGLDGSSLYFDLSARAPKTVAEARALESRAQSTLTLGAGLATVPDEMMRALEEALLWFGGMRQAATTIRTSTGADLPWPTVNDTTNKGRIVAQNVAVTPTDTTFSQTVFKSFKYSSDAILVSVELLQDNAVNLPSVLGGMLGERIGRIQNEHFTTGAGTTLPWGLATRSALGVTGTAGGGITYGNLVDMEHSVDISYRRQGAAWMMNDTKLAYIKKLVDGSNRPLLNPSTAGISQGFSSELLGYPVIVNNDMATASTTGTRSILFGALQKYMIRDVMGVELLRLNERYAENHQVAFLAFTRSDGDLLNAGTNPVRHFVHTT